jgi:DNA-binding transcriptional ArsR family regulator
VGREGLLQAIREFMPAAGRIVSLEGARGVGSSAVASELVREARGRFRSLYPRSEPVVIHVDVSAARNTHGDPSHGVAAALLRHFQRDAPVQGASTCRIMWWFLRRLVTESRPVIVWLDQVRRDVQTLDGVVGPLLEPGPFVEGAGKIPPVFVVTSGSPSGDLWSKIGEGRVKEVRVPPLAAEAFREVVTERARQTGRVLSEGAMAKLMAILTTRGNSLSVMEEVLNSAVERAGCHGVIMEGDVVPPSSRTCPRTSKRLIELRVLEILRKASAPVEMGELVQELSRSLASEGERTLSPSSVRRWLIRLEGLGLVKRRVVMGGDGGTTSVASLA